MVLAPVEAREPGDGGRAAVHAAEQIREPERRGRTTVVLLARALQPLNPLVSGRGPRNAVLEDSR